MQVENVPNGELVTCCGELTIWCGELIASLTRSVAAFLQRMLRICSFFKWTFSKVDFSEDEISKVKLAGGVPPGWRGSPSAPPRVARCSISDLACPGSTQGPSLGYFKN